MVRDIKVLENNNSSNNNSNNSNNINHIDNNLYQTKDLLLSLSVQCSGNPSSNTRPLQLHFELIGTATKYKWIGKSELFKIYHHRKHPTTAAKTAATTDTDTDTPSRGTKRSNLSPTLTDVGASPTLTATATNIEDGGRSCEALSKHQRLLSLRFPEGAGLTEEIYNNLHPGTELFSIYNIQ